MALVVLPIVEPRPDAVQVVLDCADVVEVAAWGGRRLPGHAALVDRTVPAVEHSRLVPPLSVPLASTGDQIDWGVMPEYFVRVTDNAEGSHYETAQKAYASSAAEAEKIVQSRAESRGIPAERFEFTAYEVSEDGIIQGFQP